MNEERIQKLANRLPGGESRTASSEELLELCHALLAPTESVADPTKATQSEVRMAHMTHRGGGNLTPDDDGLNILTITHRLETPRPIPELDESGWAAAELLEMVEPVSEPSVAAELPVSLGCIQELEHELTVNQNDGGWVWLKDIQETFRLFYERVVGIEPLPAVQPNPPETPDSWPGNELIKRCEESRAMIGRMCREGRPPIMRIPLTERDEDQFIVRTLEACIKALRHQITVEQLGQLEGEIISFVQHNVCEVRIASKGIRSAFARLRANAQPAPSGSGSGENGDV